MPASSSGWVRTPPPLIHRGNIIISCAKNAYRRWLYVLYTRYTSGLGSVGGRIDVPSIHYLRRTQSPATSSQSTNVAASSTLDSSSSPRALLHCTIASRRRRVGPFHTSTVPQTDAVYQQRCAFGVGRRRRCLLRLSLTLYSGCRAFCARAFVGLGCAS